MAVNSINSELLKRFINILNAYFPIRTDFFLTRLFHLVKSRSRCKNKLRDRRRKAASQQPAAEPCYLNKAKAEMIHIHLGIFF